MQKNIVIILSSYQLKVFLKVVEKKNLHGFICITSYSLLGLVKDSNFFSIVYCYDNFLGSLNIFPARKIVRNLKCFLNKYKFNGNDVLWTANDEHPIDQCVKNLIGFENIIFFEDGIGSYITSKLFNYNKGFFSILIKLRKFFFYFPYYRALYGMGGNFDCKEGYSFNPGAYPMQKNIKNFVIDVTYRFQDDIALASDKSVIFIGQPLVELKLMSKYQYIKYIKYIIDTLEVGCNFIYKPHPLERNISYLKSQGVKVYKSHGVLVEDYIYSSGDCLRVYSFLSTTLLNVKSLKNVSKVVAIKAVELKKSNEYYHFLSKSGIEVLNILL